MSIPKEDAEGDQNRPTANSKNSENKAESADFNFAESGANQGDTSTRAEEAKEKKPWDVLKETVSLRRLMESDGHRFSGTGKWIKCCCPFHDDNTPSFVINEEDTHGRCFGCGWFGNIFDYEMEAYQVDFREAFKRLSHKADRIVRGTQSPASKRRKPKPAPTLTKEQREQAEKYAARLATDEWVRDGIIRKRFNGKPGWSPETLRTLGLEESLGWAGDALAFIYPSGIKYRRWPGKEIVAECEGISLWRAHRLPKAETVYLTEGETDAISLIDTGIETDDSVAVLSLWSATGFQTDWAPMFRGKTVVLCLDNDDAGHRAMQKIGVALGDAGVDVIPFDWKEVA